MLNIPEINRLTRAYTGATEIPVTVIDDKGNPVVPECSCYVHRFCQVIQDRIGKGEECRRAHLYGAYQAERFGEAYTFFCPFGLVHWVAPIVDEYQIAYSLVAGPVLMSSPENALIDGILFKNGLTEADIRELRQMLEEIPVVPPARVDSLARLLFATASYLSRFPGENTLESKQSFFRQQASIGMVLQSIKSESQPPPYPLEKEKELLSLIRLGDKPGAQRVLNEILGFVFFSEGLELDAVKTRVIELVVLLSRAALEGGADNEVIFGLNYRYLKEIDELDSVDEIAFWLSKVMTRFTDCVFNLTDMKNADIIYKAVAFLRDNYMRDITLESVAKEVGLSPSYFSKVFKEEIKVNFRTYLNKLRIEKSKAFLNDDAIPLVEVAGLAGFQDQSYFSRVFKKVVGISPGEFRRSRGLKKIGGTH